VLNIAMPIDGEYEPSTAAWVRDQVELYEGSGGTRGTTLRDTGLPVVIVTNRGAKSGKVRKTPVAPRTIRSGTTTSARIPRSSSRMARGGRT